MATGKNIVGNLRGPAPWKTPVAWAANTDYGAKAPAACVTTNQGVFVCTTAHTSGSSFDASKWVQIITPGVGTPGPRGASLFNGLGPPSDDVTANAIAGVDAYIDLVTGETYQFT